MDNSQDFSTIHGEDYSKRYSALIDRLAEIEEEHIDYFKSKQSKFDTDPHDLLINHYKIETTPPLISLIIIDPDLKDEIIHEMYMAQKTFFPNSL